MPIWNWALPRVALRCAIHAFSNHFVEVLKEIDVPQELEKTLAECEEKAKALQTTLEEREEELEAVVGDKQAKINTEFIIV